MRLQRCRWLRDALRVLTNAAGASVLWAGTDLETLSSCIEGEAGLKGHQTPKPCSQTSVQAPTRPRPAGCLSDKQAPEAAPGGSQRKPGPLAPSHQKSLGHWALCVLFSTFLREFEWKQNRIRSKYPADQGLQITHFPCLGRNWIINWYSGLAL